MIIFISLNPNGLKCWFSLQILSYTYLLAGAHHEIPRPVNDRGSVGRAGAPCVPLVDGHPGAGGHALAHPPPGHDPQQPLHAQVSKYSVQSIFIIIHLNLCRLGSNWHLEASLKSVCEMNFCNLLQHQPKTRRLWTLWTIFIVNFMTIFMYIDI